MNNLNGSSSPVALRAFLMEQRRRAALSTEAMALVHDLEGAIGAQQVGLAWISQERLLATALHVWLTRRGQQAADPRLTPIEASLAALDAVQSLNPALGHQAWELLQRPLPPPSRLTEEVERTLRFIRSELDLPMLTERAASINLWADDTAELRAVATAIGIARDEQWYLGDSDDLDWHSDAVAQASGAASPNPTL